MRNPRARMIDFKDMEKNDNKKRKALKLIIKKLKPIASGDIVLNNVMNIAKAGLKEVGYE